MRLRQLCALFGSFACVAALTSTAVPAAPLPAAASKGTVPTEIPSKHTPSVLDGSVNAIVRMGEVVVIGGTFTHISSAGSSDVVKQRYIAAYDKRTGKLIPGFRPRLNGPVRALETSKDGRSVYAGGAFTRVNGKHRSSLVRLNLQTGKRVDGFRFPGTDTDIRTIARHGHRLYIGGSFSRVGDKSRHALAVVNANSGRLSNYHVPGLKGTLRGIHGSDLGRTSAIALDVTNNGRRMVVAGNFNGVGDKDRAQLAVLKLRNHAKVSGWSTRRYSPVCGPNLYTYMRDVQFSPSGRYFVAVTSGGPFRGTLCDTATRWKTHGHGANQRPAWVARTGGDTLLSVAVTGSAVFVGGHLRWMNNPDGPGSAGPGPVGPGAVPRPSLAALSPVNGLPLAWNPGRNPRGHGVSDLWADGAGLLVGGDTEWIGNRRYHRPRVASFPYDGGHTLPAEHQSRLPGTVYLWGSGAQSDRDVVRAVDFDGKHSAKHARTLKSENLHPTETRGAFVVDRTIFFGGSDGRLYRQKIRDRGLGSPKVVDPYEDPAWSDVSTGSGQTYRGAPPDFYAQIPSVTGMFYWKGRLYYSRSNSASLHWRSFSTDSGIVGAHAHKVHGGVGWKHSRGLFRSGNRLFFAKRDGRRLFSISFENGRPAGKVRLVRGAAGNGIDWNSRGSFVFDLEKID